MNDTNDDNDRERSKGGRRDARPQQQPAQQEPAEDRIAKVIARAGVASRRDAEAMIADGRVTLNGEVLTSPAINVTAADAITVDGEPLPAKERTRLWIFHKPRGLVTTARDPEGRPTVFDSLPEDMPRVVTIGRLDINTEGLLLLTNDGGLARVIAHPETGWLRRYKVRAHGDIGQDRLDALGRGISIDGVDYGPVEARIDRVQGDNVWITMGLREGKNREIKNILEHLGLRVNRLIRLSFGPFQLGDLEAGLVEEVRTKVLKDQLGDKLAAEAGVDFESPVREPIAPFGSPKHSEREAPPRGSRPGGHERGDRFARRGGEDRGNRDGRRRDDERDHGRRPERRGHQDGPVERRQELPRGGARRSVWRDEPPESGERKAPRIPRRGADPKAARTASAERPHERVGAISGPEGRKVRVERLVAPPREDRHPKRGRPDAPGRAAPSGDDRPRRHGAGERPPRRFDEAPRPDRGRGERPDRPARSSGPRPEREGFRAGPRGSERPFRGDGPRRGPGGALGRGAAPGGRSGGDRPFRGDGPRKGPGGGPDRGGVRAERPGGPGGRPGGFGKRPRGAGKGGFGKGPGGAGPKGPRPGGGGRGPGGPGPRGRRP